ncbi:arylamine N-acetyltransferase [Emticicia sp. 21SJ11W-3]|uniref:arylamine N-acetyltransferase family protein n=1 Tax=Emticicia sp. 21SJ11W-3 TaxID=2916755 RepID=UPI0020A22EDE|nr:arylamine N-acetyltransferase [Emticicia sp. 21SJ11W-3]UTA66558.1 arylamine N-acetyltransferase [Emticicia sp. 21SJ11W-3]
MNVKSYLKRINFQAAPAASLSVLRQLHRAHVFHVPFENLDVQLGVPIRLHLPAIYNKVVTGLRGGYCYELNALFNELLQKLGFDTQLISARIVNNKQPGPPFDHMALVANLGTRWLLDVGYGDLFLEPLELKPDVVQTDGTSYFMIRRAEEADFSLWMSATGVSYEEKFRFSLQAARLEEFEAQNFWKQTSPDSHFVKNLICTLPLPKGRKTLFNHRFLQRAGNERKMEAFDNTADLLQCLKTEFGIETCGANLQFAALQAL